MICLIWNCLILGSMPVTCVVLLPLGLLVLCNGIVVALLVCEGLRFGCD